jgi:hypothetical protein
MNAAHVDLARALGIELTRQTSEEDVRQEARRAIAGSRLTDAEKDRAAQLLRAALISHRTPRRR